MKLDDYEISIIKKLLSNKDTNDTILFRIGLYRLFKHNKSISLNNGRISDIKTSKTKLGRYAKDIKEANAEVMTNFNNIINSGDFTTRLNIFIEEHKLIIKARESMILAISSFNSYIVNFRIESFLLLSNIAWTSLLQSIAQKNNIHISNNKKQEKEYYSISQLINKLENNKDIKNILTESIINNLKLLIKLRDEITHTPDSNFPDDISSYIQANCFNFNHIIKTIYGANRGLDNTISTSIQMATFNPYQVNNLIGQKNIANSLAFIQEFEKTLSEDILQNTEYKCRIHIISEVVSKRKNAPITISNIPEAAQKVFIKEKHLDPNTTHPYTYNQLLRKLKDKGISINRNLLIKKIEQMKIKYNKQYTYTYKHGDNSSFFKYSEACFVFLQQQFNSKD